MSVDVGPFCGMPCCAVDVELTSEIAEGQRPVGPGPPSSVGVASGVPASRPAPPPPAPAADDPPVPDPVVALTVIVLPPLPADAPPRPAFPPALPAPRPPVPLAGPVVAPVA